MKISTVFCIATLISCTLWGCGEPEVVYSSFQGWKQCKNPNHKKITLEHATDQSACIKRVKQSSECGAWFGWAGGRTGECACWPEAVDDSCTLADDEGFALYKVENQIKTFPRTAWQHTDKCIKKGPCSGYWHGSGESRHCMPAVVHWLGGKDERQKQSERKVNLWQNKLACKCAGWWADMEYRARPLRVGMSVPYKDFIDKYDKFMKIVEISVSAKVHQPLAPSSLPDRVSATQIEVDALCPMMFWSDYPAVITEAPRIDGRGYELAETPDFGFPNRLEQLGTYRSMWNMSAPEPAFLLRKDSVHSIQSNAVFAGSEVGKKMASILVPLALAVGMAVSLLAWRSWRARSGWSMSTDGEEKQMSDEELSVLSKDSQLHFPLQA